MPSWGQEGYLVAEWSEAVTRSVGVDMADSQLRHAASTIFFPRGTGRHTPFGAIVSL